jgi:hypothetical protein
LAAYRTGFSAEDLEEFNDNIVGTIEVIAE